MMGCQLLIACSGFFRTHPPRGDSQNIPLSTAATDIHAREVVRCRRCLLVQYRTLSDLCRRCDYLLPSPPRFDPLPANGGPGAFRPKTFGPIPFVPDRNFASDGLQPRGKTARELTIGRKLRELREQRNLTQQEMACRAGVPRTYISRIENARLLPGPLMLQRIADALAVEILDLLPQNKNGVPHSDGEQDPFWACFVSHFSQLRTEEMSLVVSRVRSLVNGSKDQSFALELAAT